MIGRYTLAGLLAAALLPFGGNAYRKTERGNEFYRDGRFDDALRSYIEAQADLPDAAELYYDIGNVLFRQDDFAGAAEAYTQALEGAPSDLVGAAAYNLGNARFRQRDYEAAVEAYEQALRTDPDDADAKRNLELALRALEEQQRQQQGEDEQEEDPQAQEQPQPEEEEEPEELEEPTSESQPAEPEEQQADPESRMTPRQAERMLDGLEEQERENLRRKALEQPPPPRRTTGEDW